MALVGQRFPQESTAEALDDALICVLSRKDLERLIPKDECSPAAGELRRLARRLQAMPTHQRELGGRVGRCLTCP
jgi:hypothetical protein